MPAFNAGDASLSLRCATSSCPFFCPFSLLQCLKFCGIDRLTAQQGESQQEFRRWGGDRAPGKERKLQADQGPSRKGSQTRSRRGVATQPTGRGLRGRAGRGGSRGPLFSYLCLLSTGRHYFGICTSEIQEQPCSVLTSGFTESSPRLSEAFSQ